MNRSKGCFVKLATFNKWSVGDAIKYETVVENGSENVVQISCVPCGDYLDKIKTASNVKGQIQKEVEVFAMGTNNVKKHALLRHLSGNAHKIALDYKRLLAAKSHNGPRSSLDSELENDDEIEHVIVPSVGAQPRIREVEACANMEAAILIIWYTRVFLKC